MPRPVAARLSIFTLLALLAACRAEDVHVDAAKSDAQTLVVALEIDRDSARLVQYTVKDRAFAPIEEPPPRAFDGAGVLQLELRLFDEKSAAYTRRVDVGPVCFLHAAEEHAHIEGDTVRAHRDAVVVELPAFPGADRIEVAWYSGDAEAPQRRPLGQVHLSRDRSDVELGVQALTSGAVLWPESFSDPDIYQIWGDEAEGAERINIVIVPDGYTYADKALMQQHAEAMVTTFRSQTPFAEHDPLINYTLVYAYSTQSGTDECDCETIADTAMGTRFPNNGYPCGSSGNRTLYYGGGCDTDSTANIVAAELRAPYRDYSVVMVNTARYGGAGGSRAVYAAGHPSATAIAVHELGHTIAGLDDEYEGTTGCGASSGGINTSLNAASGAWPEWIAELGAPREGARYYTSCIYRPADSCMMRALSQPFCAVCNQRLGLVFFGHPRIAPTAPVRSSSPGLNITVTKGTSTTFSVTTRFAIGAVTNSIIWTLEGPGFPTPTVVATGVTSHTQLFSNNGWYTLKSEVIADTSFIKPSKNGANVDTVTWRVRARH